MFIGVKIQSDTVFDDVYDILMRYGADEIDDIVDYDSHFNGELIKDLIHWIHNGNDLKVKFHNNYFVIYNTKIMDHVEQTMPDLTLITPNNLENLKSLVDKFDLICHNEMTVNLYSEIHKSKSLGIVL